MFWNISKDTPEFEQLLGENRGSTYFDSYNNIMILLNKTTITSTQVRGMATLKEISKRLKTAKDIQKFTNSLKMASTAKYKRAKNELKPARAYGKGAQVFFYAAEMEQDEKKPNHLLIAMTSDRGLCGAVHSNIVKAIRARISELQPGTNYKLICIGDKAKTMLVRKEGNNILMSFNGLGRKPPTFLDASIIANQILNCGYEYEFGTLYYNIYKSLVSYSTTTLPVYTMDQVSETEKINIYDSLDQEVLQCYNEFALASLICFAQKESTCSEQSARLVAMDKATKNAGKMIDKLKVSYHRTRQSVITEELIEIISGETVIR